MGNMALGACLAPGCHEPARVPGHCTRHAGVLAAAMTLAEARLAWLDVDAEIDACPDCKSTCPGCGLEQTTCRAHREKTRELGEAMDRATEAYRKAKGAA